MQLSFSPTYDYFDQCLRRSKLYATLVKANLHLDKDFVNVLTGSVGFLYASAFFNQYS